MGPPPLISPSVCRTGGGGGGQAAKDALGNDVKLNAWLQTHKLGDRSLTQGLKVRSRQRVRSGAAFSTMKRARHRAGPRASPKQLNAVAATGIAAHAVGATAGADAHALLTSCRVTPPT